MIRADFSKTNEQKFCYLCGSSSFSPTLYGGYLYEGMLFNIVKCAECGFMFLNPLPTQEILNKIYSGNDYFENYYATPTGVKGYIAGMANYNRYDEKIIDIIKKYKKSGRVLDIGCAGGRFLANAKKAGYEVFGIEPNKKMAEYAIANLGLNVACATLEGMTFENNYFDIIHAGDVVEHILELKKNMEIIKGFLAKDGILVIEQPLMYNKSLFNIFLRINMLLKKNKHTANPPAHLWEFNSITLKKFLNKAGFEIIYYSISESRAKPLTAYKIPTIKNRVAYGIKNISSIISTCPMLRRCKLGDRAVVVCKNGDNA